MASSGGRKPPIPKLKIKKGRGYNPSLVNYKESEYHYGSDFEEDEVDDFQEAAESEKSSDESDIESGDEDSDDLKVESDVDLDEIVPSSSLPEAPLPFWLREDEDIPTLTLPKSSEDLLVPNKYLLRVFSVYEILRRFHQILRLTPFRIEDFCAAIASEEQSNLLSEVRLQFSLCIRVFNTCSHSRSILPSHEPLSGLRKVLALRLVPLIRRTASTVSFSSWTLSLGQSA